MNTTDVPLLTFATGARRIVQQAVDTLRAFTEPALSARRQRAALRELEALGDYMLHDIGIHRSELRSIVAEMAGAAPVTRRRVAHSIGMRNAT